MRQYRLEPKRIRFVHPRLGEEANMVLVEAIKDGKPEVRLMPPVIAFKNETEYSDELMQIFYGKSSSGE
jgi:tRNA1(Val) A37 N6-methylase TrmN6